MSGVRLAAIDKVERDRRVVVDRSRGLAWSVVAARNNLSERQCRNIYSDWKRDGSKRPAQQDPLDTIFELIERYAQVESDLALLAEEADNSAAEVGAHKARLEAIDRQVQLLQSSGLLPRELGQLKVSADVEMVAATLVRIFHDHDVPNAARRAVIEALGEPGRAGA